MTTLHRFSDPDLHILGTARILGVRAGSEHRYTGVWVVVVEKRVFVRSWNGKPTGWYRTFCKEPRGIIKLGEREIPIRVKHTQSERLRQAVSTAYAEKYNTKASRKWVQGFRNAERARWTLELVPG